MRYLARYTHRIAISHGRLLGLEEGRVRFRGRDSKDHNQIQETSLDAVQFIRRFLLHVLPSGFVQIRYFGFWSNRNRKTMAQHGRELLPPAPPTEVILQPHLPLCPVCRVGHLYAIDWGHAPSQAPGVAPHRQIPAMDSS